MTRPPVGWLIIAALVTLASAPASSLAQVTTAEILGTIVDESAAVLPGVTITARNVQTGLERTATSNERGRYTLFALPPGSYVIRARMADERSRAKAKAERRGSVLGTRAAAGRPVARPGMPRPGGPALGSGPTARTPASPIGSRRRPSRRSR